MGDNTILNVGGVIKNGGGNAILSFECQKVTKTTRKVCERGEYKKKHNRQGTDKRVLETSA